MGITGTDRWTPAEPRQGHSLKPSKVNTFREVELSKSDDLSKDFRRSARGPDESLTNRLAREAGETADPPARVALIQIPMLIFDEQADSCIL